MVNSKGITSNLPGPLDATNLSFNPSRKGKGKIRSAPIEFSSGGFESSQDGSESGESSGEEVELEKFDDDFKIDGTSLLPARRLSSSASSSNELSIKEGYGSGRGEFVLVEKKSSFGIGTNGSNSPNYNFTSLSARLNLPSRPPKVSPSPRPRKISQKRSRSKSRKTSIRGSQLIGGQRDDSSEGNELLKGITIDSITSSLNPFAFYHFRWNLLPEVSLLYFALLLAVYRLYSMESSAINIAIPAFPHIVLFFTLTIPFITLIRQPNSYLKLPFTDSRAYRNPSLADDGLATALCLPILLSLACLWDVYSNDLIPDQGIGLENIKPLTQVWIESGLKPIYQKFPSQEFKAGKAEIAVVVLQARYELVLMTVLNTIILVLHLALAKSLLKIQELPRSNSKRFFGYMALASFISTFILISLTIYQSHVETSISPLEFASATFIQQASFYIISRLARNGFTLGELTTMTTVGTTLCLEFWRLTRARWFFKRGLPYIPPSFRSPTPIVVFQSVLIPGAFLSGFLLSPLLVISRHIAGKPSHRLKWPTERDRHRRLLAIAVFISLFGIIFFLLGGWAAWMLVGGLTRPWSWAINFIVHPTEITTKKSWWNHWYRLILVAYWAGTITFAIAGWTTRFVRARRIRMKKNSGEASGKSNLTTGLGDTQELREGAVEGMREEKKVHASLNMRRKFFHALAVLMFIPGIAIDPCFTSLAFSLAFAIFIFSEYARYFALYPIGAPLHIFFSEFVDAKDSGPVILSHFYLLTGCAGGLWLEGRGIKRFTGVLVLGVADALASIVGKLVGRIKWPGTTKTVEGTAAFAISLIFCAWILRFFHLVETFPMIKYTIVACLTALLEAVSSQNDNMIIPLYMWSLLSLFTPFPGSSTFF